MKKLTKITKKQIAEKGVQALADRPNASAQYGVNGLSPKQLKLWFDKLATFLAEKINEIYDTVSSDDAADYIRVALDDCGVGSLMDLVEAMRNGEFASKILQVMPAANSFTTVPLQQYIYNVAQALIKDAEKLEDLKNYVNAVLAPRLYPPRIYPAENLENFIEIIDDVRNGFLVTEYNCYVDGVFRFYKDKFSEDELVSLSSIVPPGTEGTVTVASDGEGFGIKFSESLPSNGIFFSNIATFVFEGVTYTSGVDMNWNLWIDSELSPEGFTVNEDGYVLFNGDPVIISDTYTRVRASDAIIEARSYRAIAVKSFTVANLNPGITSGNIFRFYDGMTWADWKKSDYNLFFVNDYEYRFAAISNGEWIIDVACIPDTPVEGIGYANGAPVYDGDLIEAGEYYYYDFDTYDPTNEVEAVTMVATETSKTLFEEKDFRSVTLNGIDGLTDNVSSIVANGDGTVTVNYETDTDLKADVYYTGI